MFNAERQNLEKRSWGEIAYDFFLAIQREIAFAAKKQQMRFAKIAVSLWLLAVGSLIFLVGLANFIGELINNKNWPGYLLVGAILLALGLFFYKRDK